MKMPANPDEIIGKLVRVTRDNTVGALHPTETRSLQVGDIISVREIRELYGYASVYYEPKGYCTPIEDVELLDESTVAIIPAISQQSACACPTLIFGHHNGCAFAKETR